MALTPKLFRRQVVEAARTGEAIEPLCPHAPPKGFCGGCTFQDRSYATQIAAKHAALRALWAEDLAPEQLERIGMVASPSPFAYRTRMDYVASKDRFGLRRGGKFNYIVDLDECHLIPPTAFALARELYERAVSLGLPDYNLRSHEGFLRYLVVRRSPQDTLLFAIVTASREYAAEVEQIAEQALAHTHVVGFHWLLNESLTDISFGTPVRHWGAETLPMQVGARTLAIGPNTFFQNNVHLLLPLLDDVKTVVCSQNSDVSTDASHECQGERAVLTTDDRLPTTVADLYGGVGTIALHLAEHVEHITCVESFEESARLGRQNVAANGVPNVEMVYADTLAFLREQPAGRFATIVADPPRTGLGPDVCRELLRLHPERLVYVSCNALTQLEDARALAPGYRLAELRGYDMFPQTPHLEALAVFDRV
ncbi:MAG TPA: methyltransferase [Roseiflexaceae bacterium]|nr:methyltransferase [Roseiflexaceae bacterium]